LATVGDDHPATSGADPADQLVEGGQQRTEIRGVTCQQVPASGPVRPGLPRLAGTADPEPVAAADGQVRRQAAGSAMPRRAVQRRQAWRRAWRTPSGSRRRAAGPGSPTGKSLLLRSSDRLAFDGSEREHCPAVLAQHGQQLPVAAGQFCRAG